MSMIGKQVAARFRDGRVVKGWTTDFQPARDVFHVRANPETPPVPVPCDELKAVFFLKSLPGDPGHDEDKTFREERPVERRVWVEFEDGEQLAGWAMGYASKTSGFYLTPPDPESNMERAYVYRAAIEAILTDDDAEEASQRAALSARPQRATSGTWELD